MLIDQLWCVDGPTGYIDRAFRAEHLPREHQTELTWPVPRYHLNLGFVNLTASRGALAGVDDTNIRTITVIMYTELCSAWT